MITDFSSIIGHEVHKQYLQRVLANDALAHGYCFSGASSLGKSTLARLLAAEILTIKTSELSQHPDFRLIDRLTDEKTGKIATTISVEVIRDLRSWMSLTSVTGQRKVVIIKNADLMTVAAQNALLKTLEEPSGEALIMLMATDASQLLPTIISRVVHLNFSRVARETLCDYLKTQGQATDSAHDLAGIASGRPGVAINLLQSAARDEQRQASQLALEFLGGSLSQRMKMILDLTKEAQKTPDVLETTIRVWYQVTHDALLSSLDCSPAYFSTESDDNVNQVGRARATSDWSRALRALIEAQKAIRQNVNPTIALEHFALSF